MTARTAPRVGDQVYDKARKREAVVTDIRRAGTPDAVYVLRPPWASTAHDWTATAAQLRPVDGSAS